MKIFWSRGTTARTCAGQAATEVAIFGAILIFVLGSIVRSSLGNSYTQNQSFKSMRIAMLASWNSSVNKNSSRNNASILFVEDRLSPDLTKYGSSERQPYVTSGSGTFSYRLMYPLDEGEVTANLPVMDVYVNGQHFPFSTERMEQKELKPPASTTDTSICNNSDPCLQARCLRLQREWRGSAGIITADQISSVTDSAATMPLDADAILKQLIPDYGTAITAGTSAAIKVTAPFTGFSDTFKTWFTTTQGYTLKQFNQLQEIFKDAFSGYQLFYTMEVNSTKGFLSSPPACNGHPCPKDQELSADMQLNNEQPACNSGTVGSCNADMHLQYDLNRNGIYTDDPNNTNDPTKALRKNMLWQWAATAGEPGYVNIDRDNNNFPTYDVDGDLKEETLYDIDRNAAGNVVATVVDDQDGDMDMTYDQVTSCGPKPGLQKDFQIYTFFQDGTYLQIKEGQLYNPENGQMVRSTNKKNEVDLIQRNFQLSNDTHRFCYQDTNAQDQGAAIYGKYLPQPCVAPTCPPGQDNCCCTGNNDSTCKTLDYCPAMTYCATDAKGNLLQPNPVEACVPIKAGQRQEPDQDNNCFTQKNIKLTCFDQNTNMLFIRSRIKDRRGRSWITDTSGQMSLK